MQAAMLIRQRMPKAWPEQSGSPAVSKTRLSSVSYECDWQMWIGGFDLAQHVRDGRRWFATDLSFDHDLIGFGHLLKGQVETRFDRFANAAVVILGIARDADNRNWFVEPVLIVNSELASDGVLPGEEVLDHRFVHNGDARDVRCILGFDSATREDGNADHAEVIRTNVVLHRGCDHEGCRRRIRER